MSIKRQIGGKGLGALRKMISRSLLLVPAAVIASLVAAPGALLPVAGAQVTAHTGFSYGDCTYTSGSQSVTTTSPSAPGTLTNITNNAPVTISCTGLPASSKFISLESSPLAGVVQPATFNSIASVSNVGPVITAVIDATGGNQGSSDSSGTMSGSNSISMTLNSGSAFTSGVGSTQYAPTFNAPPDPNAQCPPTQAQINAGLGTCEIIVANESGISTNTLLIYSSATITFSGQATPVAPTVSFNPPAAQIGHTVQIQNGTGASFWGGGWWAGGLPNTAYPTTWNPVTIPASDILVNGVASSSPATVTPPGYCIYGGSSISSCNLPPSSNKPSGVMFPATISGSITVPAAKGSSVSVDIVEPNSSPFPGDNSLAGFPSNDLLASGSITIPDSGYWLVASDGGLFSFGTATFYGSMGGKTLNAPVVGMAVTPSGGYYEVASDGGIFAFGNKNTGAVAPFYGSMGGKTLNAPVVGMAVTPSGGYYEVASDGGIFAFGNKNTGALAPFYGSMGGKTLNAPVVGMAITPEGGYYEVASDGGIFAFGPGATFHGSMGGKPLNKPVVGMAVTPGGGYYEVASDGGLFSFGGGSAAPFYGSMGGKPLNKPVVGMAVTPAGGYYEVASDGGLFSFGPGANFYGSTGSMVLNKPVVGMAIPPLA